MKTPILFTALFASLNLVAAPAASAAPAFGRNSPAATAEPVLLEDMGRRLVGRYDLHFYHGNNKPFLHSFSVGRAFLPDFGFVGILDVPNDYQTNVRFIEVSPTRLTFEVLVPRRRTVRLKDVIFRYDAMLSESDYDRGLGRVNAAAGLVQIVAEGGDGVTPPQPVTPAYVGSFLLFRQGSSTGEAAAQPVRLR